MPASHMPRLKNFQLRRPEAVTYLGDLVMFVQLQINQRLSHHEMSFSALI